MYIHIYGWLYCIVCQQHSFLTVNNQYLCVMCELLVINACNASLRSDKFSQMAKRTRRQYLLDLVQNSCLSLGVDQIGIAGIAGNDTV